jgi:hypothetical protein
MPQVQSSQSQHGLHPYLLFNDISETPGYKYQSQSPWKGWKASILSDARAALSLDFSESWSGKNNWVSYHAYMAQELALAYQITKDPGYAAKAKEALMNMDVGEVPENPGMMTPEGIRAISLLYYSLAYDWTQPTLDEASDKAIRDKLALLSDRAYKDLTVNGQSYVTFDDHQGQAYPIMGIAGVVLDDYTNPDSLSLSSGPDEWRRVGTDYLFVSDKLHDPSLPLTSYQIGPDGKDLLGSYKVYYIDDLAWWAQVYTRYYGRNFFDAYPLAKAVMTSEVWESLPDGYSNDFITNGNVKMDYHRSIANLLDPANRSYVLALDNMADAATALPESNVITHIYYDGQVPDSLLFLVYDNYSSVQPANPPWTSHLGVNDPYQVLRGSWDKNSGWMSMITFNDQLVARSYRNMEHHDQMSIEYYDKGEILLADGGEDRNEQDKYGGRYDTYHNTIAIEDPRDSFGTASWSDSPARGIFKATRHGMVTPSTINYAVTAPWMSILDASATIKQVIGSSYTSGQTLSSPISYERLILYPDSEYFIIIDRTEGTQTWTYRNIFRPASFDITPTGNSIGHVNGDLYVGGQEYDWLSQPYKSEASTGMQTSSIQWSTKNPYSQSVNLQIYTVPSSEVLVTKGIGRIGGYGYTSEVYSPVVYFREGPQDDLYRVTVLLSSIKGESARTPETVQVTGAGEGNALKVSIPGHEDYIYSGKGESSFGPFATDADTAFIRLGNKPTEYTLIQGSRLDWSNEPLVSSSKTLGYLTMKAEGSSASFNVSCDSATEVTLHGLDPTVSYKLTMDGAQSGDYSMIENGTAMQITLRQGEHSFKVSKGSGGAVITGAIPTPSMGAITTLLIIISMSLPLLKK